MLRTRLRAIAGRPGAGAAVIVVLALVAVFTNAPGWHIADARFEEFDAPWQFLRRHRWLWDDQRSLGQSARYFSPALTTFHALAGSMGAPAWVIERLSHALMLSVGGVGTLLLSRRLVGRPDAALVAGLFYAFSPYTSQYLLPSPVFFGFALAPWFALVALRGVARDGEPWRWAAAWALLVFSAGALNTASLLYAMLPAAILVVFVVLIEGRSTLTAVGQWLWRSLVLTVGISAALLVVLSAMKPVIDANVAITETPEVIGRTSSASESWRGLGFWLSYFRFEGIAPHRQTEGYLTNPLLVVAAWVPMLLAGVAILTRPGRRVAMLITLAALSVVVMVGLHPVGDPTPFGDLLGTAFDSSSFVRTFRSTYKAGAGLELAVALLAGVGAASLWQKAARFGSGARWVAVVGVVGAGALASYPFWTGHLYSTTDRHDELPGYWEEALDWFDAQSHDPAVLVLPSASRSRYEWGYVNDVIADGRLSQPAVSARTLPQSTPEIADLTEALDAYASSPSYRAGSLGPALRRLGVGWILVQNDRDFAFEPLVGPEVFDSLRVDPDFELVEQFGALGENVGDGSDRHPLEIYAVIDPRPAAGVVADTSLALFGGGEAWPTLGALGLLEQPLVPVGAIDAADRLETVGATDGVVFTDGARRRALTALQFRSVASPVLGAGEDGGDHPAILLYDETDLQSVIVRDDIDSVTADAHGRDLVSGWQADLRPELAVDGDERTAWAADRAGGAELVLRLRSVRWIDTIEITPFSVRPGDRRLTALAVTIERPDGSFVERTIPADRSGALTVEVGEEITGMRVRTVVDNDVDRTLVGVAEVHLVAADGTVEGRSWLRVPGPAAGREAAFDRVIQGSPVHHVFSRVLGEGSGTEETTIRREFWAVEEIATVGLFARVDRDTPDETIAGLMNGDIEVFGSVRTGEVEETTALNLVDSDPSSGWRFSPTVAPEATLTIRTGGTAFDTIELWSVVIGEAPFRLTRPRRFEAIVDGRRVAVVETPDDPECADVVSEPQCIELVVIELPEATSGEAVIRVSELDSGSAALGTLPVEFAELVLLSQGVDVTPVLGSLPSQDCRTLVAIDGGSVAMRPRVTPDLEALVDGVEFESCSPVELSSGWHRLEGARSAAGGIDWVHIANDVPTRPSGASAPVQDSGTSPVHRRIDLTVEAGQLVVSDVPAGDGWNVRSSMVPGRATVADGFVAWRAEGTGQTRLDLDYAPQRTYELAWAITGLTLLVSMWLLVSGRRPRRRETES